MTELEYSEFLKSETDLEREAEILSLEHHGIKGQKHGVRRGPPYPLERGKGGSSKKKKKGPGLISKIKKKVSKPKKDAPKEKKETKEQSRKKALSSTDPKYIYKYRDLLTTNELQDRINRINKEKELRKLTNEKSTPAMEKVEKFLKTSASMAESVTKIYNSYNAVASQIERRQNAARQREEASRSQRNKPKPENKDKDKPSAAGGPKKTEEESDLSSQIENITDALKAAGSTVTQIASVTKSYETLAKADPNAARKYQQNLLARAEEEKKKRIKAGFK